MVVGHCVRRRHSFNGVCNVVKGIRNLAPRSLVRQVSSQSTHCPGILLHLRPARFSGGCRCRGRCGRGGPPWMPEGEPDTLRVVRVFAHVHKENEGVGVFRWDVEAEVAFDRASGELLAINVQWVGDHAAAKAVDRFIARSDNLELRAKRENGEIRACISGVHADHVVLPAIYGRSMGLGLGLDLRPSVRSGLQHDELPPVKGILVRYPGGEAEGDRILPAAPRGRRRGRGRGRVGWDGRGRRRVGWDWTCWSAPLLA